MSHNVTWKGLFRMNHQDKLDPQVPSAKSETDDDILTDDEMTTISAGSDFNAAKNANNGEGFRPS
jgi:hypothetical protein